MIPKIAFLFLTIGNVSHESIWVNFFKGHEECYSVYVHPKESLAESSFFADCVISKQEPTTWANTMKAQIVLLQEALKDQANSKFVFLSESTIPLTTFERVYQHLLAHPRSEFAYEKNPHKNRVFGVSSNLYKNSQWIVLNRKHAQLMVEDTSFIKFFSEFPHDQEHYPSSFLAHHNLIREVVNHNTTVAVWKEGGAHPHRFSDLTFDPFLRDLINGIKHKCLFARKFAPTCDLSLLHRYAPELFPRGLLLFLKNKYNLIF